MPTVFRWHEKKEFKCHIHSSFSHDIDKQIWILLFAFRFRLTLKNGFKLRISFFAFASLWKTDTNFSFRFLFSHHFEKRIWIAFFVFALLWKTDLNFVSRFHITLKNRISFVTFAWLEKRITAPVQSFEAPATPSGLTKWYDDSCEKRGSYRNTYISSMEKENDEHFNTLQPEVTKCEIRKKLQIKFHSLLEFL